MADWFSIGAVVEYYPSVFINCLQPKSLVSFAHVAGADSWRAVHDDLDAESMSFLNQFFQALIPTQHLTGHSPMCKCKGRSIRFPKHIRGKLIISLKHTRKINGVDSFLLIFIKLFSNIFESWSSVQSLFRSYWIDVDLMQTEISGFRWLNYHSSFYWSHCHQGVIIVFGDGLLDWSFFAEI